MFVKKVFNAFVAKYGVYLCSLAVIIAGYSINGCKKSFYQPKEPDGLADFVKANIKR